MLINKYIKTLLLSISCFIAFASWGQSNYIGFYGTFNDYTGGLNGFNYGILRFNYYKPGPEIAFQQYLSPFFDIKENFAYDWVQYEVPTKTAGVDAQFLSADLIFRYKFANGYALPIDANVAPFIEFGGGGNYIKSRQFVADHSGIGIADETRLNALAGIGLTFRLNESVNLEIASKVYMPMLNGWDGRYQANNDIWSNAIYTQESIGFTVPLGRSLDSDHDGVPDKRDLCPGTPKGVKVDVNGCPLDSDGDGIPDYLDKCPTIPGLAMYQGCPTGNNDYNSQKINADPDSDGDGVPDSRDKCANTPINTPVDVNGCPIVQANNDPDTDGDGVPDRIDRCPNTPGPASNRGCPEIKESVKARLKFATRGIYFETNKAVIKQQSNAMLDEIVDILNQYPDYNIRLTGHTDNVGNDLYNLSLSQSRVDAVMQYLENKGIAASRLEAIGYGKTHPIANNNTAVGRALNRRVEIELYLK